MITKTYRFGTAFALVMLTACGGNGTTPEQSGSLATITAASVVAGEESTASEVTVAAGTTLVRSAARMSGAESLAVTNEAALASSPTVQAPAAAAALEHGPNFRYEANMTLPKAARLLNQASMGATMHDIEYVAAKGIGNWVVEQSRLPQTLHRTYVAQQMTAGTGGTEDQFYESFWKQVCTGRDQLRQRVAFGLSQIFVVSFQDDYLSTSGRMMAGYYDVLGQYAFGNFRDLLQGVATHPAMAMYLTFMHNRKESETTVPDENFARELMQLMTIGLYELNLDGTPKMVNGKPVETYTTEDVKGLAKVFTGWSWAGPDTSDARFYGAVKHPDRDWKPLQNYPQFHSTSAKQVLGKALPTGSGEQELNVALDRLFNHPNVGPFIGRQLIQRLVTSNPSPAYVRRVATAFNSNEWGERGNMVSVIKAILYDDEARSTTRSANFGRVREPILREANWMRAFYADSVTGKYQMWRMDDPLTGFGQAMLRAPSVFNFYRPTYAPSGTPVDNADLVAPELQIASEPAVIGYLNTIQNVIFNGIGKGYDIRSGYGKELALVDQPGKLVDRMNLLFMGGEMSPTLRRQIQSGIESISLVTPSATNQETYAYQSTNRVYIAAFLAMATPEYIVQK